MMKEPDVRSGIYEHSLNELFDCGRDGISTIAEDEHGNLVTIGEVPKGLACKCICPGCGRQMVARKGEQLVHHFAHYGTTDLTCISAGETALHKFAKQLLNEQLRIGLPAHSVSEAGEVESVVPAGPFNFDTAILEKQTEGIVPDVILIRGARKLIVEFMVTHACGSDKISQIRELDIGAIEIDLSGCRNMKLTELVEKILFEAPRSWLHNPKDSEARQRARARAEAKAAMIAEEVAAVAREYKHQAPSGDRGSSKDELAVYRDGLGNLINLNVRGSGCFNVLPAEWQAASLQLLLQSGGKSLGKDDIYRELVKRRWIIPRFQILSNEVITGVRNATPYFDTPSGAVYNYLKVLEGRAMLQRNHDGKLTLSETLIGAVTVAKELRERPAKRYSDVETCVCDALKDLPENETVDFDIKTWANISLPGRSYSVIQALQFDDMEWRSLRNDLVRLRSRICDRPTAAQDLMGLPLAGELARSLQRKAEERAAREEAQRQKAQAEANRRVVNLQSVACQNLGGLADDWLATPNDWLDGQTPMASAEVSSEECARAERALEQRIGQLRREDALRKTKEKAQAALWSQVKSIFDDERASLWMRSAQPKLGRRSPEDFVVDDKTLSTCIELLPNKKKRRYY